MSGRPWSRLRLALVAGLAATACAGPADDVTDSGPARGAAAGAQFVGRDACASCHVDETDRWTGSHHDLAMQPADPDAVLGDFSGTTFTYGEITTTFSTRDGRFLARTDGPDGELHDYPIAYAFGADPLQQYLVEFPDGRLQALSIAWDARPAAQGGQRWFHLYPDDLVTHQDVLHWTGFAQNWNLMCAECHSTNLRKNYDAVADRYATTWSEIDVSCEACHGPASRHVAWAQTAADEPASRGDVGLVVDLGDQDDAVWRVDPGTGLATRSVARQSHTEVEICARCHSRRELIHETDEYGRPLMDTHRPALLTDPLYFGDGQARDEVYVYGSFLQSRMYQRGVTCSDCHDPHGLSVRGDANARCAACHLPDRFDSPAHHFHDPQSAGASCVACHMPSRTYMGVDARRDHSFPVPRPDLTLAIGTPNACNGCHADRSPQWAADAVSTWYDSAPAPHFGETFARARRGDPGAGPALADLARNPGVPGIVRATALTQLGAYAGAEVLRAAGLASADPDPLVRLGAVAALDAAPPDARLPALLPLVDDPVRAVRLEAARSLAAVRPDRLPSARRAAFERALDEYVDAQRVNADRAESHVNLGILHAQRDEQDEAAAAFEAAIGRNPSFVPAYVNLAEIHRRQQRDDRAERVLTRALERLPEAADLHHALGLTRVRLQRQAEALPSLARAAELAPDQARYAYVFGVALYSAGRPRDALEALGLAHDRHPYDVDILAALATMSRDVGVVNDAVEYARRLVGLMPNDPEAQRLLADLEAGQ